jgi:hypothetical protein
MDVAATATAATATTPAFEDALRQEAVLIPEDLADIHIESPVTENEPQATAVTATADPLTTSEADPLTTTEADPLTTTEADPLGSSSVASVVGGRTPPSVVGGRTPPGVVGGRTPPSVVGGRMTRNLKKKQAQAQAQAPPPQPTERTIEQRREQVRPIIDKLTELQMNVSYPAIRELYKQLSQFIKTGEDAKIKIPFPEFSRRIKGELSNATYKPCWVKLEME